LNRIIGLIPKDKRDALDIGPKKGREEGEFLKSQNSEDERLNFFNSV